MRLLNTITLELHPFNSVDDSRTPRYAILSHTWTEDEVVFEDVKQGSQHIPRQKNGFAKIQRSCAKARADGYGWIWIDTCCIDKSSSTELSEAINSMFEWYQRSSVCYAFLSDVQTSDTLAQSRWFTRGWTLQELIAPHKLELISSDWTVIGDRSSMALELSDITGVDETVFERGGSVFWEDGGVNARLRKFSIATRMRWASKRETTRAEDMAYCLMGIFDVNMPLLYGEGSAKAFRRLQA